MPPNQPGNLIYESGSGGQLVPSLGMPPTMNNHPPAPIAYGNGGQIIPTPTMPMMPMPTPEIPVSPVEVMLPGMGGHYHQIYNSPEVYIPNIMNSQQRPPQQQPTSYPIVYSGNPQKPQQVTPVVWYPNVIFENLGKYAISNEWRFLHLFWGCISSPFHQPSGTAKSIGLIVVGVAGTILCFAGLKSMVTNKPTTITVDPSQVNPSQILAPVQRTIDIR